MILPQQSSCIMVAGTSMQSLCVIISIEKALKGLYQIRLNETPPKVHNLVYLLNKIGIKPAETMGKFLIKLNEVNIATRYPEDIDKLQRDFTQPVVKDILSKSKEALEWIKTQL